MGFIGISDFNISLLSKQFLRLLTGEHYLMERVFKSRYYPRGSILTAKVGFSPSYAWRRILSASELIKAGTRWRIRTEKKWKYAGFKILSPTRFLEQNSLVSELIDQDLLIWKRDILHRCFDPTTACRIVSIPLYFWRPLDKLIWHSEKNKNFSVKSTYHILSAKRLLTPPDPSCPPH